jgi:hypothetical protein
MRQQVLLNQFGTIHNIFFVLPAVLRVWEADPLDKELHAALALPPVYNCLHFPFAFLLLDRHVM